MDPLAVMTGVASALGPILVPLGSKCLSMRNKAIRDHKVTGLCLPEGSGKSVLARNLNADDIFVIDLDSFVLSRVPVAEREAFEASKLTDPIMYDIHYKRLARSSVEELKRDFVGSKRLLILASSLSILAYVGVKASNCYALCPSLNLHNLTHSEDSAERKAKLSESRMNFIMSLGKDNIRIFDSWEQLAQIVRMSWGLKSKL